MLQKRLIKKHDCMHTRCLQLTNKQIIAICRKRNNSQALLWWFIYPTKSELEANETVGAVVAFVVVDDA